jgi:hypothetical protein
LCVCFFFSSPLSVKPSLKGEIKHQKRKEKKEKKMSGRPVARVDLLSFFKFMIGKDERKFAENGLIDDRLDFKDHVLASRTTSTSLFSVPDYIVMPFPSIRRGDDSTVANLREVLSQSGPETLLIDFKLSFPSLFIEDFGQLFEHFNMAVNGFRSRRVLPRPEYSVLWFMLKDFDEEQPKIPVFIKGMKDMVYAFYADLSPLDPKRFCDHCGPQDETQILMRCGNCKAVRYCVSSEEEEGRTSCQKEAWNAHRAQCSQLAAAMTHAKAARKESTKQ